jgi:uncharacterized protein
MINEPLPQSVRREDPFLTVTLHKSVVAAPPEPSPDVARVAAMFGLGVDASREIAVLPRCTITLRGGQLVFITGPSGSGKSTLLRCLTDALDPHEDARVCDFHALPALPDRPLIDTLPVDALEDRLRLLSIAGLGDAPVMLRRPTELSDGQRYRLRFAHAMALAETDERSGLRVVLADEFGATLDRRTAGNVATQLRKWVRRQPGVCFVCATTHDDLLEPLEPDVLIEVPLGEAVHVHERAAGREGGAP